jgi:transcriptional regulator with XRE-family HTH domain
MDPAYLWRIEEGRQNLSRRNVARIAKALGVSLAVSLEGVDVSDLELGSRPYGRRGGDE